MNGFVETDGSRLYYETVGSGLAVLFIHAGVADCRMWDAQFNGIDGHRLIRFDMRGYGRSELGTAPFTNHGDALAVLDYLEIDQAVVVGCSIGANAALQMAASAPDRLSGLVLIGGDAPGFDPGIDFQSPEWPDALAAFHAGDLDRVAHLDAEIWLAGVGRSTSEIDQAVVELFVEMDLIALQNEEERDEFDAATPLDGMPDVDVQVLVVVGEHDIPQMRASAQHLAARLSDRPVVVIEDAAHLPSMDQPESFNQELTGFLGSL